MASEHKYCLSPNLLLKIMASELLQIGSYHVKPEAGCEANERMGLGIKKNTPPPQPNLKFRQKGEWNHPKSGKN